eukprot:TRINITY_DN1991_c0_g1_i1.p1 TRINITY_DN1991_c0_g1~~TRINITY_DN1991_c0_g1_i1.p1  ORF type:complete len:319 (-),score=35.16 TRINITY_DN1991_c0_g1_i1:678-1634(-)
MRPRWLKDAPSRALFGNKRLRGEGFPNILRDPMSFCPRRAASQAHVHASYRWYVTGTPFPRDMHMESSTEVLHDVTHKRDWVRDGVIYPRVGLSEVFLRQEVRRRLYWRNTKGVVKEEVSLPPIIETVGFVQLSPVHQALHDVAMELGWEEDTRNCVRSAAEPAGSQVAAQQPSPSGPHGTARVAPVGCLEFRIFAVNRFSELVDGGGRRTARCYQAGRAEELDDSIEQYHRSGKNGPVRVKGPARVVLVAREALEQIKEELVTWKKCVHILQSGYTSQRRGAKRASKMERDFTIKMYQDQAMKVLESVEMVQNPTPL